jgi:hypothetical protein
MKKVIKLNENDLTRIVRRVINESGETQNLPDVPGAMRFLDKYLQERGGPLGPRRTPEDIVADLKSLQWAIKLEMNNMDVASQRRNPNWGNMDDMEMGMDVDFDDNM